MAFDDRQRDIIESHLYLDDLGEDDGPKLTLELNKRQARLLLEAVEHFQDTKCPSNTGEGTCAMLYWAEDVHTGAIERVCDGSCAAFVQDLLTNKVPAAFPPKVAARKEPTGKDRKSKRGR